jgi:putative transposase
MKPSRFTEEQIIGILREHEAGAATADVCLKHGISSATFYKWKAKYGGLEVSDARRLTAASVQGPWRDDEDSCINVSGLSRASCCCSQAMMRSARIVLK